MSESSTKGGNIIISNLNPPDSVRPGEAFTVEVEVTNGAAFIGPWDPDACEVDDSGARGYELEVVFEHGGEEVVKRACQTFGAAQMVDRTYSATFTAPESGRAEVSAYVRLATSGKETERISATSAVTEDAPREPVPNGDETDSGNDINPFNGNGNGGPLGQINGLMTMVVVVMLIGALMESGALGGASS